MTIKEAAEQILGIDAPWDSALPQEWCDNVKLATGIWPKDFVWVYDVPYTTLGRPCALTAAANQLLDEWNAWRQRRTGGYPFPLTANPVEEEE